MATLFRPWAQPDPLHQDQTISTTSDIKVGIPEDSQDNIPREVKFICVKEHMRIRSEKKNRRSRTDISKSNSLRQASKTIVQNNESHPQLPTVPGPPQVVLPSFPYPPAFETFVPKSLELLDGMYKDCWDELSLSSPELLEAALSQGMPPAMLEDYVRALMEQQRQIAERNRKQRPKKFRCPHCQVGFSNNGQLKGHIRIHTGERPFKCEADQCGKSFTRNEELTRHRRIHSGLRPFPCPECGKRFGRKDHLKKHVRTHYHQRYQLIPILPSHYPYLLGL